MRTTKPEAMSGEPLSLPVYRHPFEPFLPQEARILFLGSFPPQEKRWSMPFYYPNSQNDFWRIMGVVFFSDKDRFLKKDGKGFDMEEIKAFSTRKGLAFYDSACAVRRLRDNASDKWLEVVEISPIMDMLDGMPHCCDVAFTGEKSARVLLDSYGLDIPPVGGSITMDSPFGRTLSFHRLPSSSRAYPLSLEKKAEAYRKLLREVGALDLE